jgi:putative transposase
MYYGSEFSGQLLALWAYHHHTRIDFSRPGKPTDNCHIETFNGSFRDECLNLHWFESLDEAKMIIEAWRQDYDRRKSLWDNCVRPHSSLNYDTPEAFSKKTATTLPTGAIPN